MLKRNLNYLLPTGAFMLSGGLLIHNFLHGRCTEFAAGFLIGMSLVFVIAGFVKNSRFNLRR